ncbi:ceramide synthase 5 isoform X6 [Phycodurus eques]|uniref:ceramide synthase 5 isoform X6 n=1 Tax=Phycodurus eques TaxID=693459 RepID=UPI002ACE88F8|nr:ceramide synthase 5 isoform X6 [Phycodurus eques]XP_061543601.1 ceramide synthase 5 isoform X6 [Phycodurus eques]
MLNEKLSPMQCWRKCLHPLQRSPMIICFVMLFITRRALHVFSAFPPAESRLAPSGRAVQAAGLGGAQGAALVPTAQEPRQTQHTCEVLREHTSWMWDTRHCWYGYPYQVLTPALYRYYVTELAFYWSLLFSQFTDIRRKDFLSMFVHHLATVGLISFSYANNMVRVGTLVMCVHDASDFLLEAAKLANYAKYQRLCDLLFIIFSLTFFLTRLVIFPIWVLNSTMFESWLIVGPFPSWWLFNVLLLVLQVLHVIWSYLIARIAIKAVLRGKKLLGSSPCGLTDPIFLSVCVLFFAPLCPLSTPLTTLRFFLAVCNDVRSDVESSSEDESPASRRTRTTHARKAENGTNGHYAAARSRPHATPT